ncbi:MAG: KEOPS complex N(6)-L-threonylcarbamoyladenine synthase Kae1 [Candidatus Aenigmatarchaeota archaeon]|nr:N(6)-L-threonylcarbamoyladenine synthase Kae1 [Candidatus Aenigmarchaeota archaeon]
MISLGLEGTAHTFGCGIVNEKGEILSNEKSSYIAPLGKGIIPTDAAEHHSKVKEEILRRSLEKADITMRDIDVIAYSAGPGLAPCLLVTANFAEKISTDYNKPLVPVHHGVGHIEIGRLTTGAKDPIIVYLSGGHTAIIGYTEGYYKIFGETENITLGNVVDMLAREIGLSSPGGPYIEKLALKGNFVELPYTVKGCDLSFSGTLTAAINKLKRGIPKEDICYSVQETCFSMVVEVTERALAHTGKNEVLLVGGVAANKRLQNMFDVMVGERGGKLYVVPHEYSGDQGAMISWVGLLSYKSGWSSNLKDKINPRWRIDEIKINWF